MRYSVKPDRQVLRRSLRLSKACHMSHSHEQQLYIWPGISKAPFVTSAGAASSAQKAPTQAHLPTCRCCRAALDVGITSALSSHVGVTSALSSHVGITSALSSYVGVTSALSSHVGVTSALSSHVGVTSALSSHAKKH
jgi:hypothetical protein